LHPNTAPQAMFGAGLRGMAPPAPTPAATAAPVQPPAPLALPANTEPPGAAAELPAPAPVLDLRAPPERGLVLNLGTPAPDRPAAEAAAAAAEPAPAPPAAPVDLKAPTAPTDISAMLSSHVGDLQRMQVGGAQAAGALDSVRCPLLSRLRWLHRRRTATRWRPFSASGYARKQSQRCVRALCNDN
jgi:hypothetical protein